MPGGRPTKPPVSQKQAHFYFAEAARGTGWAKEKVAKIQSMGTGSLKRLPKRHSVQRAQLRKR